MASVGFALHHHVVERGEAISGDLRLALQLINTALCTVAGLWEPLGLPARRSPREYLATQSQPRRVSGLTGSTLRECTRKSTLTSATRELKGPDHFEPS
jgi:hypothetical protein